MASQGNRVWGYTPMSWNVCGDLVTSAHCLLFFLNNHSYNLVLTLCHSAPLTFITTLWVHKVRIPILQMKTEKQRLRGLPKCMLLISGSTGILIQGAWFQHFLLPQAARTPNHKTRRQRDWTWLCSLPWCAGVELESPARSHSLNAVCRTPLKLALILLGFSGIT